MFSPANGAGSAQKPGIYGDSSRKSLILEKHASPKPPRFSPKHAEISPSLFFVVCRALISLLSKFIEREREIGPGKERMRIPKRWRAIPIFFHCPFFHPRIFSLSPAFLGIAVDKHFFKNQ
jgi:hypothetical protein